MTTKMELKREILDDYTNNIPYRGVTSTKVLSALRSPKDFLQLVFNDDVNEGFIGESYKSLSLESNKGVCFSGFTRNLADSFIETKASTSIEFHGMHTYNSRANTDNFYTIYNDPYGILTWGGDTDKTPTIQLTGFVREQYNRKMILLGNNVNRATIDYEFVPEWYVTKRFGGSSPFTNTPLVPANTLTDDHSSFLIMDRLGQKFYMSETQQMLQEAKGFRLNVYDTTAMKYEGAYNWGTHRPATIETEIGVSLMPEDKHIIFDIADKTLKIDLDGEDATGKIIITAGTTILTITKDGDVHIDTGSNETLINTTSGAGKIVIAEDDGVTITGVALGDLTTSAGQIIYTTGFISPIGPPVPPGTGVITSINFAAPVLKGTATFTAPSTRKVKVE